MQDETGTDTPLEDQPQDILTINGQDIGPGEETVVRITVGRLPSGTRIFINAFVFRSKSPGPVVLAMGGVHGDEINGIEIVRRCLEDKLFTKIKCGTVIAIPLVNVFGFISLSRDVPDGKDVNRSFPGNMRGSLASRVARVISKTILPAVDLALDFHTGASSRYNYPQVRYSKLSEESFELARAFAAPFIIRKALIRSSMRKVARDMHIPMIIYEGGEALRLDDFSIMHAISGMRRVLVSRGMLDPVSSDSVHTQSLIFEKSSWVRAKSSGIFRWTKSSGMKVRKGEPIGTIVDPYASKTIRVLSHKEGFILGHNNGPVVNQGDALFHIGYQYKSLALHK